MTNVSVKRVKTKTPGIYYNEKSKKYDIKYNYKVYDPKQQKNVYKSKWIYNLDTIGSAKKELFDIQADIDSLKNTEITMQGAYDLWLLQANAQNYSPASLRNTKESFKMLTKFINPDFKIKDFTEDTYYTVSFNLREHGYSEETLHTVNATFRKLINLVYKRRLIEENPLHRANAIKIKKENKKKVIPHNDFIIIDNYFRDSKYVRLGVDCYPKARLMFNLLYYTGIRIGECLALNYTDLINTSDVTGTNINRFILNINKSYLSDWKIIKEPKNIKPRKIPFKMDIVTMLEEEKKKHLKNGGSLHDRIFNFTYANCQNYINKACMKTNLPHYTCHEFRHTYISNLMKQGIPLPVIESVSGDTQQTILSNYSHLFENDELIILNALDKIGDINSLCSERT